MTSVARHYLYTYDKKKKDVKTLEQAKQAVLDSHETANLKVVCFPPS
jgi:hypothetical protein